MIEDYKDGASFTGAVKSANVVLPADKLKTERHTIFA